MWRVAKRWKPKATGKRKKKKREEGRRKERESWAGVKVISLVGRR